MSTNDILDDLPNFIASSCIELQLSRSLPSRVFTSAFHFGLPPRPSTSAFCFGLPPWPYPGLGIGLAAGLGPFRFGLPPRPSTSAILALALASMLASDFPASAFCLGFSLRPSTSAILASASALASALALPGLSVGLGAGLELLYIGPSWPWHRPRCWPRTSLPQPILALASASALALDFPASAFCLSFLLRPSTLAIMALVSASVLALDFPASAFCLSFFTSAFHLGHLGLSVGLSPSWPWHRPRCWPRTSSPQPILASASASVLASNFFASAHPGLGVSLGASLGFPHLGLLPQLSALAFRLGHPSLGVVLGAGLGFPCLCLLPRLFASAILASVSALALPGLGVGLRFLRLGPSWPWHRPRCWPQTSLPRPILALASASVLASDFSALASVLGHLSLSHSTGLTSWFGPCAQLPIALSHLARPRGLSHDCNCACGHTS